MKGLAGRGVLITGGTSGIGLATAQRFQQEGCRVYVVGNEQQQLEKALAALAPDGRGGCFDVSDPTSAAASVTAAETEVGPLSVLANNAGVADRAPFLRLEVADWDRVIAVNLRGMFLVAQAFARLMVDQHRTAAVVNMASTNAIEAEADYAHYNASKAGVLQLTRTMAVELGSHGIRVNALCPGYIDTPLSRRIAGALPPTFAADYARDQIPLGRIGTPEEVAAAYAFLASDEAAFITGAAITVDGGQTVMP